MAVALWQLRHPRKSKQTINFPTFSRWFERDVQYRLLRWILEQEGTSFQRIDRRWRPTDLLYLQQVQAVLEDIRNRYNALSAAESEIKTLDRASLYLKALQQMRIFARAAGFSWKTDQLTFVRSVSRFYENYGAILRLLKDDEARGRLTTDTPG